MSEQAKHTPGPWTLEPSCIRGGDRSRSLVICGPGRVSGRSPAEHGEDEANARLIAAAPELLQACREALADLEGYLAEWETDPALETVQELRAVIAKATGQD